MGRTTTSKDVSVDFEGNPVNVQDFRKITDSLREIHKTFFNLIQKNQKTSTYNRSVLETLGS